MSAQKKTDGDERRLMPEQAAAAAMVAEAKGSRAGAGVIAVGAF